MKTAAIRLGMTPERYRERLDAGEKWCGYCRDWHSRDLFGSDARRADGLMTLCREARRLRRADRFVPVPAAERRQPRPPAALARDGDAVQARHTINYMVASGRLQRPNDLACTDCGHVWSEGERRHEYDHYLGYGAMHHKDVEPVCSTCHAARERSRKTEAIL